MTISDIAIIGTGISGMGAACLLHPACNITVYEKDAVPGGHTRTRVINYNGKIIPVDTGFIVYNERNYPHLTGLFKHLNVPVQKSCMTFGVTVDNGSVEWGAQNINAVFGQRRNILKLAFWRMLLDIARFNRGAVKAVKANPSCTLGELLQSMQMGKWFLHYYLLPMGGAIWSCPPAQMLAFPAQTFVQFFENHGLLTVTEQPQWYTVTGGSKEYMKRLTAPFADKIKLNCAVKNVKRINNKVEVTDSTGETKLYDHAILACHADQTLAMLGDASAEEKEVLGSFSYQSNIAVLHRDVSFMPKHKACWSSWIYHTNKNPLQETSLGVTYWMNLLQSIDSNYPLFVTLNPTHNVNPETVFDTHIFEHPIFNKRALDAQAKIPALQGKRNIWFCGAYQRYGFHEDGLLSAVNVARALGAEVPWH